MISKKKLENIESEIRSAINQHLEKTGDKVHNLAKDAGVHPTQIWMFLREERGLTTGTIQKIGKVLK